jgi:hypothetical protein
MYTRFAISVLLGFLSCTTWAEQARAHGLLVAPKPRDQQDGYKDPPRAPPGTGAPCGVGRTVPPQPETNYAPGLPLTIQWTETVDHPGCFVIDFANQGDMNFQILGVKSHATATGGTPRSWSLDVTLPSTPCTGCTLRLRQLMLAANVPDSACPPNPIPAGATYYSCANVTLGADAAGGGSSAGGTANGTAGASNGTAGSSPSSSSMENSGCSLSPRPDRPRAALLCALAACGALMLSRRRRGRAP